MAQQVRNSDQFLDFHSQVERWLQITVDGNDSNGFLEMASKARRLGKLRPEHLKKLEYFAKIRNLIAHDRYGNDPSIEPHAAVVEDYQRLKGLLINPPKVLPSFAMDVATCKVDDLITLPISLMNDGMFSQVPVSNEDGIVALLTAETITRWLASEITNQVIDLSVTKVDEVLQYSIDQKNFILVNRNFTLNEAANLFESQRVSGNELDALIITEDGKKTQKTLGILTVYDMPKILGLLGVK